MKKRTLLAGISLSLVATVAIAGTAAYLTDTAENDNTMTLGKVDIEQWEYQRVKNDDGTYKTDTFDGQTSYVLEGYEQDKPLLPIVGDPSTTGAAYAGWDDTTVRMTQVGSWGGMQVLAGKNAQDKFVTVKNTGNNSAYVRTLVAVECGATEGELVGTTYHSTWDDNEVGKITIDGNNYILIEYMYKGGKLSDGTWRHENGVLPAGDMTYPNLSQVYIKSVADNDDMVALDGNGNGKLDILVFSQAVQADGFDNAETALDAAFGDVTTTNHPWVVAP